MPKKKAKKPAARVAQAKAARPGDANIKRERSATANAKRAIQSYDHARGDGQGEKRVNNPQVGLVSASTEPLSPAKETYQYDPRLAPRYDSPRPTSYDHHLPPSLQWAGKAERTSFEVPTVSLHVHERIDACTMLNAVRKRNGGNGAGGGRGNGKTQLPLFETPAENPPLREAIEFYQHAHNWSNRLVAGDSLLVMNSLLQKENMAGKVQCIYMDPPYGIKYGSNFQPFVHKRDVKDGKDEDLTAEPEMIKAFRDTWELGIHSYLSYMRDRLLLARELLSDSGSVFVQISDENVHHVREIMDEVFGVGNFVVSIILKKTGSHVGEFIEPVNDYVVWYAKDKKMTKVRSLFENRVWDDNNTDGFNHYESDDLKVLRIDAGFDPKKHNLVRADPILSSEYRKTTSCQICFGDKIYDSGLNHHWSIHPDGIKNLWEKNRLVERGTSLYYRRYYNDYPVKRMSNIWNLSGASNMVYVVQTNAEAVKRCMLMTTDPGDLVFDPTCGSGTTAFVAEQWGRRWITCDTSRVAIALAKQRLMTATFDYYQLMHPNDGVSSGFRYKTVPHITPKSIANNEPAATETLYDQPLRDTKKARVTGPFTAEAVPAPMVISVAEALGAGASSPANPPLADGERPPYQGVVHDGQAQGLVPTAAGAGSPANPPLAGGERPPYQGVDTAADASVARGGETLRQQEWRDELLKTGIRGKGGQHIAFARVEALACRYLHADAETKTITAADAVAGEVREAGVGDAPRRAVISFGPEHAPLEQRQVEEAWQEAGRLNPKPAFLVFTAFAFDPEAAKDIAELNPQAAGMQLLQVQMNADLQTGDLRKGRASNESFWLVGQPDVEVTRVREGAGAPANPPVALAGNRPPYQGVDATAGEQWQVTVRGFDYFDTRTGKLRSGAADNIAVWMLDTDYDGRSLYPSQVFFPMADAKSGWAKLARNLKAEIDEELIEAYRGVVSLPFTLGTHRRVAVKIVDDRGIESLRVVEVK